MPPRRTRLKIPGMCAEGPPSYSETEMSNRHRLRREAALAQVSQDATYCIHYSSIRDILNSRDLADQIARYPEGDLTPIAYFHQVPADTPQDPRNLWLRKQDPTTGAVTVTSAAEDPWDRDVILTLPDGAWLAVQAMAHNLARWTARIDLGEQIVTTKTLRRRVFALAGRITRSARRLTLHLPRCWPWEEQFSCALGRLRAIPLPA